jgi:hypothetical protein
MSRGSYELELTTIEMDGRRLTAKQRFEVQ